VDASLLSSDYPRDRLLLLMLVLVVVVLVESFCIASFNGGIFAICYYLRVQKYLQRASCAHAAVVKKTLRFRLR
jgi:hypothetical protein